MVWVMHCSRKICCSIMSNATLVFLISFSYNFLYLKTKLVIANSCVKLSCLLWYPLINFLPMAVVWRHRITRSCLVCMKSIRIKVCFVRMIVICVCSLYFWEWRLVMFYLVFAYVSSWFWIYLLVQIILFLLSIV